MLAIKYYIHNATYISFLENEDVDVILNIVDASNLSRNLYLMICSTTVQDQ